MRFVTGLLAVVTAVITYTDSLIAGTRASTVLQVTCAVANITCALLFSIVRKLEAA